MSVSAVKVSVLSDGVIPSMKFELQCNTLRMKIITVLSDSFRDSGSWIPKHARKSTVCTLATSFYYIALGYMLLCISIHNCLQPTFIDPVKTWLACLLLRQPQGSTLQLVSVKAAQHNFLKFWVPLIIWLLLVITQLRLLWSINAKLNGL